MTKEEFQRMYESGMRQPKPKKEIKTKSDRDRIRQRAAAKKAKKGT